jgi:hypothetical protein
MNVTGVWILIMGILALPGGAIITRWMSPIGAKAWGLMAGIIGGLIGIVLLEVIAGGVSGVKPLIPGEDAFSVAVLAFFGVSAASAAIGLLVNWLINSFQNRNGSEEVYAE